MKILQPVMTPVEIGPLKATVRLPMSKRKAMGIKTVCAACGKNVEDEFFVGGFQFNGPNLILHEKCAPGAAPAGEGEEG